MNQQEWIIYKPADSDNDKHLFISEIDSINPVECWMCAYIDENENMEFYTAGNASFSDKKGWPRDAKRDDADEYRSCNLKEELKSIKNLVKTYNQFIVELNFDKAYQASIDETKA